jgi:predicted lipoprotein with Yx(FWY)xxD motif
MPDAPGAGHGPEPTADPPPRGNPGIPGVKAGKPEPIALAVTQTALGPTLTLTGSTVYRFNGDANRPTNSVCIGQCATAWPPLLTDGTPVHAGPGIDPTALGLYQRDDGTRQVTLGGWPLYLFSEDRAPGDTSGNNLGPTPDQQWKAVGPTGEPVRG